MKRGSTHSCNILDTAAEPRKLWLYEAKGARFTLAGELTLGAGNALPAKRIKKDWLSLWRKKVNIAWLSSEQVFVRVVQLPRADLAEMRSMVSLQLEKLSPVPVNQIVWSIEPLPSSGEGMQSVVVLMARRDQVDALLGKLEAEGFQADRLDLPRLYQLEAVEERKDGVWLYPVRERGQVVCLAAWWRGGALQVLQLVHLPDGEEQVPRLLEQLTQTAWAGEMEGWLTQGKACILSGNATDFPGWERALQDWSGAAVATLVPPAERALADAAAARAGSGLEHANLLPADHATRYHQTQIDRLWMNGLIGLVAAYSLGVMIYFGALQVLKFQRNKVVTEISALGRDYTNSIKLNEQIGLFQTQIELRYSALDVLYVAAEGLPLDLAIESLRLSRGQNLTLTGTATAGAQDQVNDYYDSLRKASIDGRPFFSSVTAPNIATRGREIVWNMTCVLAQGPIE